MTDLPFQMVKAIKKSSFQVSADSSVADFKNFEKIGKRDAENVIEKPIVKKQKIEQKEQNSIKRLSALTKTKFEAPPAPKEKSTFASSDKVSSDHSCFVEKSSNLAKYIESTVQTKEYICHNTHVVEASGTESSEESGSEENESEDEDELRNLAKYTESIVQTKEYTSQNTHVVEASRSDDEDIPGDLAKYTKSIVQTKGYVSQNTFVVGANVSEGSGSEESESNDEDATNPKDMKMEISEKSDKSIDGSRKLENGHGDGDCKVEWKTPEKDKDLVMKSVTSKSKELYMRVLESKTLYCQNISHDIDADALYDFFKEAGEVIDVHIYKLHYGHSACVKFATAAEVTKALELDGQELKGCRLRLSRYKNKKEIKAQRAMVFSKTIFCANISSHVNIDSVPDAMCNFFKEAGRVVDVRLARHLNGAFKGFGHVVFATTEEANKALKLNGRELLGRQIRIEPAERNDSNSFQNGDQSKAQKGATAFMDNNSLQNDGQSKVQNGVTAFIKGFSMEWDANKIKANLFNFFASCGEITHITLLRGGALLDFKDSGSLNNALLLNGLSFYGNPLIVDRLGPHDNRSGGRGSGNRGCGGRGFRRQGGGGRGRRI